MVRSGGGHLRHILTRRRADRVRRRPVACQAVVRRWIPLLTVVALASACTSTGSTGAAPALHTTPSASQPGPGPLLGVVTSSSPAEQRADQFGAWLGSPVRVVGDYTDNSSWDAIAKSFEITNLEHWLLAHPDGQVELSVGMLPQDRYVAPRDATPTQERERVNAMARGSTGAFDSQWRTLAETLVRSHLGGAIIRTGWESNGDYYPWSAAGAESQYAAYFRRIVTVMRSVAGAHFKFDWTTEPGALSDGHSPQEAYPGQGFVDYVGVDVYDENGSLYPASGGIDGSRRASVWRQIADGPYGLQWFVRFARSHGTPLLVGEWGLYQQGANHGGGDDTGFIRAMHDFLYNPADDVYAAMYFNEDPGGSSGGRSSAVYVPDWGPDVNHLFPKAAAEFRSLFGHAGDSRSA